MTMKYRYRGNKGNTAWFVCDRDDLLKLLKNRVFIDDVMWIEVAPLPSPGFVWFGLPPRSGQRRAWWWCKKLR